MRVFTCVVSALCNNIKLHSTATIAARNLIQLLVQNLKPTGKRPVGRPKQRWMDNIEKDLKRASLSLYGITTGRNRVRLEELVGDRERWKDITAASMAGRAFRMTT